MTAAAGSLEGLAAARQERPSTLAEATEALRRADRDGERVLFVGGGTELSLGAPPTGVEVVLATERLERIVEHAPLDLFAEGPTEDWALPLPEPMPATGPGRRRYSFELDGLPPGASATGATLRFTLVSGDKAIEVTTVLD